LLEQTVFTEEILGEFNVFEQFVEQLFGRGHMHLLNR